MSKSLRAQLAALSGLALVHKAETIPEPELYGRRTLLPPEPETRYNGVAVPELAAVTKETREPSKSFFRKEEKDLSPSQELAAKAAQEALELLRKGDRPVRRRVMVKA